MTGDGPTLLGAVLAGGGSRRFGEDKTAAPVDGVPMIRRAVHALEPSCDEVVVISSRPDTPEGPWRVVPDLRPGRGPLAGIETALAEAVRLAPDPGTAVVVLASDLPLVGTEAVDALVTAFRSSDASVDAVAARRGTDDFEPLCAVYSVSCVDVVARLLDGGRSAARELFENVAGIVVSLDEGVASMNVNTRADASRAEAILVERRGSAVGSEDER